MVGARRSIALVLSLAAVAASSCGGDSVEHPEAGTALERLRAAEVEAPVATVGGRELGLDAFQRYWNGAPELEREAVVDDVVRREVAAQRAVDSGLHREASLSRVRKRAMVRELLRREVEQKVRPSDLDETNIERVAANLRAELGRPAGIRASHLVVMPGSRKSGSRGEPIGSESERETAREWASRIRDDLSESASVSELFDARRRFRDRIPEEFQISVDAHLRFPSPDARKFKGSLPDGWISVVDAFASGAHRMLEENRAGTLSEPVESPFGWHLIRAEGRLAAKKPDPEATREVAVSQRLRERRRERFEQVWKRWKSRASIAIDPEALDERNE